MKHLRRLFLILAVSASIGALAPQARASGLPTIGEDPLATLVAAEREFAQDAARLGISAAFRAHAAADGVLLRPEPTPASEALAQQVDQPGLTLEWQPAIAAVSRSNDLGFTTGPYRMGFNGKVRHGQFLTIWTRGSDGRWRWYLDHGLPATSANALVPAPAKVVRIGRTRARRETSEATFIGAEDALNQALIEGRYRALADALADDGYLLRAGAAPISHGEAGMRGSEIAGMVSFERLGSRLSADQDFAVSYGRVVRSGGDPAYYVRVWHRVGGGWRLLIDQLH